MKRNSCLLKLLLSAVIGLSPLAALAHFACTDVFSEVAEAPELPAYSKPILQLVERAEYVDSILPLLGKIEGRKARKIVDQIYRLLTWVKEKDEVSEADVTKIIELSEKLGHFEKKVDELAEINSLPTDNLIRPLLMTGEPVRHDTLYSAEIPGFGSVVFHFNSEVANVFAPGSVMRKRYFPKLFIGLTENVGRTGIKYLSNADQTYKGQTWKLYELKVMTFAARIYLAYANGTFYAFRYEPNHKLGAHPERFLSDFLKSRQ